jgi:protein involved in polysaccharide export with SLBB domain
MMQNPLRRYLGKLIFLGFLLLTSCAGSSVLLPIFDKKEAIKDYPFLRGRIFFAHEDRFDETAGEKEIADKEILIRSGTRIRILVKAGREIVKDAIYTVPPEGTIYLPHISKVFVVGKRAYELERELLRRFSEIIREPYVSIKIIATPCRVRILGMVQQRGEVDLTTSASRTLYILLYKAGLKKGANIAQIMILRGDKNPFLIICDWYRFRMLDDFRQNITLQDQDIVIVPKIYPPEERLSKEFRLVALWMEGRLSRQELLKALQ